MSDYHDIRALVAARFDENAACLECGGSCERWRLTNGFCPGCVELDQEKGKNAHA